MMVNVSGDEEVGVEHVNTVEVVSHGADLGQEAIDPDEVHDGQEAIDTDEVHDEPVHVAHSDGDEAAISSWRNYLRLHAHSSHSLPVADNESIFGGNLHAVADNGSIFGGNFWTNSLSMGDESSQETVLGEDMVTETAEERTKLFYECLGEEGVRDLVHPSKDEDRSLSPIYVDEWPCDGIPDGDKEVITKLPEGLRVEMPGLHGRVGRVMGAGTAGWAVGAKDGARPVNVSLAIYSQQMTGGRLKFSG